MSKPPVKRLLVIRLGALGDVLHASAVLTLVKAHHPDVEIHWLTSAAYRDLLAELPAVDHAWPYRKSDGLGGLLRLGRQLRAVGIDGVVNLHPSLKTWFLTQLIRPRRVVVYRKEKLAVTGAAQRDMERYHAVDDFSRPFQALFDLGQGPPPSPYLPVTPASSMKPAGEEWIGIIPGVGAKRANRAWPEPSYRALIDRLLARPHRRVLLIGGPDEQALGERLARHERAENHCSRHGLLDTARLLAQCDVVIGGDTGPLHLAAAVRAPIVAIFGPTSLKRTGPHCPPPLKTLTPPEHLACWPCEAPVCPLTGTNHLACMRDIDVDTVLAACEHLLAEHQATSHPS